MRPSDKIGNNIKMMTLIKSLTTKGMTPLKLSESGTSLAKALMTKRLSPTGGVINPTSTTIKTEVPPKSTPIPQTKALLLQAAGQNQEFEKQERTLEWSK